MKAYNKAKHNRPCKKHGLDLADAQPVLAGKISRNRNMSKWLFLILISNVCYAWETDFCTGTKENRIASLVEFGKAAQQYLYLNGEIPDLCSQRVDELQEKIPLALNKYLVCGGSYVNQVYYTCWLQRNGKKDIQEECQFILSTGEVECGTITAEFEKN